MVAAVLAQSKVVRESAKGASAQKSNSKRNSLLSRKSPIKGRPPKTPGRDSEKKEAVSRLGSQAIEDASHPPQFTSPSKKFESLKDNEAKGLFGSPVIQFRGPPESVTMAEHARQDSGVKGKSTSKKPPTSNGRPSIKLKMPVVFSPEEVPRKGSSPSNANRRFEVSQVSALRLDSDIRQEAVLGHSDAACKSQRANLGRQNGPKRITLIDALCGHGQTTDMLQTNSDSTPLPTEERVDTPGTGESFLQEFDNRANFGDDKFSFLGNTVNESTFLIEKRQDDDSFFGKKDSVSFLKDL